MYRRYYCRRGRLVGNEGVSCTTDQMSNDSQLTWLSVDVCYLCRLRCRVLIVFGTYYSLFATLSVLASTNHLPVENHVIVNSHIGCTKGTPAAVALQARVHAWTKEGSWGEQRSTCKWSTCKCRARDEQPPASCPMRRTSRVMIEAPRRVQGTVPCPSTLYPLIRVLYLRISTIIV